MRQYRFLAAFLLLLLVATGCSEFRRLQKSTDVEEKFAGAVKYYELKDYYKAAILLEEIIPLLKGTDQAEIAQFYYAYCHYHQKQLTLAAYYFKSFYETFPRSKYAEEASYMYCISLFEDSPKYNLDQTNTYSALEAISNFLMLYPESPNKEKCHQLIDELNRKLEVKAFMNARLYYDKDDYKAALVVLENFRKEYPTSDMAEEATFLKVATQYNYAKNSVLHKQRERYAAVADYYQAFIDRYPKSKFSRQAENIYSSAMALAAAKN
ncbi:MAG: outer membrane protein assembly factor BamD [Bacteroidota bacterium]